MCAYSAHSRKNHCFHRHSRSIPLAPEETSSCFNKHSLFGPMSFISNLTLMSIRKLKTTALVIIFVGSLSNYLSISLSIYLSYLMPPSESSHVFFFARWVKLPFLNSNETQSERSCSFYYSLVFNLNCKSLHFSGVVTYCKDQYLNHFQWCDKYTIAI